MKRIIALALLLAVVTITACRRDYSTLDTIRVPGVIVDTTGNSALSVYQFEHLVVKPKLSINGVEESGLRYEWRVNLVPGDTLFETIATTRELDAEIKFKPTAAGKNHHLLYVVADNNTGVKYITAWPLTVKNNIGEGLVVAESSDNANTDLSHIMSPEVTPGFTGQSIKHEVFSSINGVKLPGLVKQMRFASVYGVNALFTITNSEIVRINTLDYTLNGRNNDLFYTASAAYQPQALGEAYQSDIYVGNGKLTATYLGANRKFGIPFDNAFVVPEHVAINGNSGNFTGGYQPPVVINFYDEVHDYFVYQPSLAQLGDKIMRAYPSVTNKAFNPAAIAGKRNLAAGISVDKGFLHLLKDEASGKVELYVFGAGTEAYPNPVVPPDPRALYDLSGSPGIANATHFVILDDQKVIYYVSDNKIYAIMYSTSAAVTELRYTPPAGETITTLQVYRQSGYPGRETYLPGHNKQLIMSTWGTEGKVYLLPMKNIGLGTIDAAGAKSFGGFGKISAIAPQQ